MRERLALSFDFDAWRGKCNHKLKIQLVRQASEEERHSRRTSHANRDICPIRRKAHPRLSLTRPVPAGKPSGANATSAAVASKNP